MRVGVLGGTFDPVHLAHLVMAEQCREQARLDQVLFVLAPRPPHKLDRPLTPYHHRQEMLELASLGSKVLQTRSVEMGAKSGVPIQVLSTFEPYLGSDLKGTIVTREENIVEQEIVSGIAHNKDEAKITVVGVEDKPGVAASLFEPLAKAAINVDMIVQNISSRDGKTDMTFTVPRADLDRALKTLEGLKTLKYETLIVDPKMAKVSVVGIGMRSHAGVANKMFRTLAEKGINIQVISTSEIKISVLIQEDYTELAVRSLHAAYGLEESKKIA